jgi:RimJ/RimL family protein N-acetyltransferase
MACELSVPFLRAMDRPGADWRAGLPVLEAPGVVIREPRLSDAGSLCAMLATDAVARFMSQPPATPEAFAHFIAWIQAERHAGRCLCYGLVPAAETYAVGLIQVRQLEPAFGTAEWGFALGQPYWGTGLFVKSARLAVDFAFREIGVHRLEARSAIQNGRGNGVLGKIGAVPEGVLRESLIAQQQRADQVLWSLLSEDWLAAHPNRLYERRPPLTGEPEVPKPRSGPARERPAWRDGLPVLRGTRFTMRELVRSDGAAFLRLLTTSEVVRFILPPPNTLEGFEQFVAWTHERREAGTHVCFGVVPDGQPDAVGVFQLQQLDPTFRTAEWGFALGSPYWGTGLFAEAAQIVLEFAFDTIGVHRLEARTAMANGRGNGALRKVGAVREALLRRSFLLGGAYSDDFLWAVLAEDWRRARAGTGGSR